MGISLGSSSKKLYVGSKEVKEAYVGSQLVYRSGPPLNYGFLGGENDYFKADWCQLYFRTTVEKEGGIYRIAISDDGGTEGGIVKLTNIQGGKLSFVCKKRLSNTVVSVRTFTPQTQNSYKISDKFNTSNYSMYTLDIPKGVIEVQISSYSKIGDISCWIDEVRFEET